MAHVSIGGDLALTITDGVVSVALSNPHGDVVATLPLNGDDAGEGITSWASFDEYGNLTSTTPANTGVNTYGWKGNKERSLDASGVILMGVRLYNSATGAFTSRDPIDGGNTTTYAYPQDPINQHDLNGKFAWRKWTKRGVAALGVAAVGVCIVASAGVCGAAALAAGGASIISNAYGWRKKEMGFKQFLKSSAVDGLGIVLPGVRYVKRYPGRHSAAGLRMLGARGKAKVKG